jgi:hypothetical protein
MIRSILNDIAQLTVFEEVAALVSVGLFVSIITILAALVR